MKRTTRGPAPGWSQTLIIGLLIAICAPLSVVAQSGPVTMGVYPSSAPNVYGSPSYDGWAANAVYAIENNLATTGSAALPTYYYRLLFMDDRDNIVTGFPSWKGHADPGAVFGASFASELGNRATFGVHIRGNGIKVKLSNLSRVMHSSDPENTFGYVSNYSAASYSTRAVGIDYVDGIRGNGDDVRITSGPGTQAVDEIVFAGGGNAIDAYCSGCTIAQQQAAIDVVRDEYSGMMPFTFTMDYILLDDSGNQLAFRSGTIFFGDASLPPDLSCTKTHSGSFIQGDPGTAPGTILVAPVAPVANATGIPGTSAPGFEPSAWQASATAPGQKAELYVPATQLFGHPVHVEDIASVSWWTNKAGGVPDWYFHIFTVRQNDGQDSGSWYRSRLNSEPYLSGGTYTPNAWTLWSSADATHPLRFFDALRNGGIYGTYTDPLLSAVTSAPVTWPNGTTWDYRTEEVGAFSMQTGSGWSNEFTGLVDGLTVTLKSGEVATVNFEAYAGMYTITVSNAAASTGAGPTDGSAVTVTDTLPAGLTATAFYGPGWTTDLSDPSHPTATRIDVLGPGSSYPPLILKVAVANSAPPSVTNQATVSWTWSGTPSSSTASDPTLIQQIPTHLAFTTQPVDGQPGQTLPAVVVAVQDAGNQTVTDYTGSVTLSLTGGTSGAVLTGGGETATASGVATFSGLSVDLMGLSYSLNASAPYGAGSLAGTSDAFNITNPTPSLVSMSPFELAPGQPAFALAVTGFNFMGGSTLYFNGTAMATTFVSSTQLTAAIPASSVAALGTYEVVVKNPPIVLADSNALTFTVGRPAVVYINTLWTGQPPGASPDGLHYMGYDAFAVIQDGVNAVASGGTVYVAEGTYLEEVVVSRGVLLHGAGIDTTVLMGRKNANPRTTLAIAGNAVTVEGFTITRDGNNPTDWAGNFKDQGVQFNQGIGGSTLRYCKITGNRNGVYINNAQGNTIRNNVIDFNRTGIHLVNNVTGTVITQNTIVNNWTLGIIFNTVWGGETSATTGLAVSNNNVSGNWYSQVECRWNFSTATLDVSGNWLGSSTLIVLNTDVSEPGYAAQIPVEYGGTATNPGGAASVGGHTSDRIDYTPWLNSGSDADAGAIGFQGDFSYLNVAAVSPQAGATPRIAEAISLVTAGGTVRLTDGTYVEDVVINKSLTLQGQSQAGAIIVPATAVPDPIPDTPWEALTAGATNVILVQANNVTIYDLTVDGDNPELTSGIVRNGADVDARNGIIVNKNAGVSDNLTVHHCTVKNAYLRGIYAYNPSKAAIDFHHNTVDNIQGDSYYSIGVFSRQAVGTVADNVVSRCPDAISANWSHGLQFLNNIVTACGSGVHTDNSGQLAGDLSDLLQGNIVSAGASFGGGPTYGVWAFAPYRSLSIQASQVTGVDVGLALYGQGAAAGEATFSGNTVDGQSRAGAKGAVVSTFLIDNGAWTNVKATFTGNTLHNCAEGIYIEDPQGFTADVTAHTNDLSNNSAYGLHNTATAIANATCNYWGAASGPAHSTNPLGTGVLVTDNVTFAPWSTATPPAYTCDGTVPTTLVFTVQPSDTMAGASISPAVAVTVTDATHNPVTWFTGPVTLVIGVNPGGGMLWGTATVTAVNGVATFADLSIDQAGVGYTLTALATGLTGDTSAAFNVTAPSCMAPNFTSASPAPDVVDAAAQQVLTITNPQGSSMPTSFAFRWDAAFVVHTFGATSPGVPLGFWQEMRPYASPFVPTALYPILWVGATSAFVDLNGNGTYEPGTDYPVVLSDHTVAISRTVSPPATESQRVGYRLVLQSGIIDNPDISGNYPVTAILTAPCGSWTSLYSESIQPSGAGCSLDDVGDVVRLAKSGDTFTVAWTDATPSACAAGYGVFASTDCKAWKAFGTLAAVSTTQKEVTASTGLSVTYILVAEVDSDGGIGPLGHYNQ